MREREKMDLKAKIMLLLAVGIGMSIILMPFMNNVSVNDQFEMGVKAETPSLTRGTGGMYGGIFRIALKQDIDLDPLTADDEFSEDVINLVYDSLARIDSKTLLPKPWIAESWTVNTTTNRTIIVELREDVTWHDGTALTADDVVYTYSTGGMKSSAKYGPILTGVVVEKIDDYTVEFTLDAPNAAFFDKILRVPLIPEEFDGSIENGCGPFVFGERGSVDHQAVNEIVIANYTAEKSAALDHGYVSSYVVYMNGTPLQESNYTMHPDTGTILFITLPEITSVITADYNYTINSVRLDAYDSYFIEGKPYLDGMEYIFFLDDLDTIFDEAVDKAAKALIRGEIDFIGWTLKPTDITDIRWQGTPYERQLIIIGEKNISVTKSAGLTFLYLGYNTERYPLNDPFLRRAMACCFDKETMAVQEGEAIIVDSVVSPYNVFWYNTSVPKYGAGKTTDAAGRPTADLTRANEILDESGYLDVNNDGWRESPNGTPFNFLLLSPQVVIDPRKAAIANSICDLMRRVGINAELELNSSANRTQKIGNDDFDMYLEVQEVSIDPSCLYDLFHSNGTSNLVNYANDTFDHMIEKANGEMDTALRQQYIRDCLGWLGEHLPSAPLLYYKAIEAHEKTQFTGWVSILGGVNNFWSFINMHYVMKGDMTVEVDAYPNSVTSTDEVKISGNVKNKLGTGLKGAEVNLTYDGEVIGVVITEPDGRFDMEWIAPNVTAITTFIITAKVSLPHYWNAQATTTITIHPLIHTFDWTITAQPNIMNSSEESTIYVIVLDETLSPVEGADVILTVTPENAGCNVSEASGKTDATGTFTTTFTGTTSVEAFFKITATVKKLGYGQDTKWATIAVHKPPVPGGEWFTAEGSMLLIGTTVIIVCMIVIMIALIALFGTKNEKISIRKKRRKEK